MGPLANVRLPPVAWLVIAAAIAALLRFVAALQVQTPIFYPDEYRAAALARSVAEGGLPRIRGEFVNLSFTSYIPTVLQAPAWLIDDVDVAYRAALALGCISFAAAAFPAYHLARRLGISDAGSLLVAVIALVLPAGAYTSTLLSEPYTYPAFLLATVLGVHALASSRLELHLATLVAASLLCLVGGLQFLFFGSAYACAWIAWELRSPRTFFRRAATAAAVAGAAAVLLALVARELLDVLASTASLFDYSPTGLIGWLAAVIFMTAVAAGWVLLPGAVLGLASLVRSSVPTQRAFALLAISLLLVMLAEAAVMSRAYGLHERFTFYGTPLLAAAFVWAAQHAAPKRLPYAALAYLAAVAAVVLPITGPLRGADDDHAPTLMGLAQLHASEGASGLVWAPALVLLAVVVARWGPPNPARIAGANLAVCSVLAALTAVAFVRISRDAEPPPRVAAPPGTTLITWTGGDSFLLQKALFWNRNLADLAVVGDGPSPDSYAASNVTLAPGPRLVDDRGSELEGPFAVGPDTDALRPAPRGGPASQLALVSRAPSVLAFGLYRDLERLGSVATVYATAQDSAHLEFALRSPDSPRTVRIRCDEAVGRTVDLTTREATVTVPIPAGSTTSCRVSSIRGLLDETGAYAVGAGARLTLAPPAG